MATQFVRFVDDKEAVRVMIQNAGDGVTKYQVRYADYEKDEWTAPVLLTKERCNIILNDVSVADIKIFLP